MLFQGIVIVLEGNIAMACNLYSCGQRFMCTHTIVGMNDSDSFGYLMISLNCSLSREDILYSKHL